MSGGKLAVLGAAIPSLLVALLLSAIFGEWVLSVAPVLFVVGVLAVRWWLAYRDQVDSDDPLDVPGHGSFSDEAKRVLARKAVLLMFGLSVLAVLAFVFWPRLLG